MYTYVCTICIAGLDALQVDKQTETTKDQCVAIYSFAAVKPTHLNARIGQRFHIVNSAFNWWLCRNLNGETGTVLSLLCLYTRVNRIDWLIHDGLYASNMMRVMKWLSLLVYLLRSDCRDCAHIVDNIVVVVVANDNNHADDDSVATTRPLFTYWYCDHDCCMRLLIPSPFLQVCYQVIICDWKHHRVQKKHIPSKTPSPHGWFGVASNKSVTK